MANSYWYFSSKQLEADLQAAEANPQITCHFLHINSPGGEAWYLDRLSETLRSCEKPILTYYEQMCCSAGYYIGCHGQRVYARTANDYVGCIGTMCSFYNFEGYYEKLGIKHMKAKATKSDLKNKIFEDVYDGKYEKYVNEVLNPMNEQFLSAVRSQRSKLTDLLMTHQYCVVKHSSLRRLWKSVLLTAARLWVKPFQKLLRWETSMQIQKNEDCHIQYIMLNFLS